MIKFILLIVLYSFVTFSFAKTVSTCDVITGSWEGAWDDALLNERHGVNTEISFTSGTLRLKFKLSNNEIISYIGTCVNGKIDVKIASENSRGYKGFVSTINQPNHIKLYDLDRFIIVDLFKI